MSKDSKIVLIKEMIESAEKSIHSAKKMLAELTGEKTSAKADYSKMTDALPTVKEEGTDKIVEGVFDGEIMTAQDGEQYPIPANYASKSKLVPGDVLKLTIKENGTFLFKQIGPVERKRVIGTLTYEDGQYKVIAEGKAYKVILASVTYFKGEVGGKVTLIVPANEESEWGAIENILPQSESLIEE
jgi:hypothetical protein